MDNDYNENKPFTSPLTEWIIKNKQEKKKQRADLGYVNGQLRIEHRKQKLLSDKN